MKISVSSRRELENQGSGGSEMMPNGIKIGSRIQCRNCLIFYDFLMGFWIDFGVILEIFWDEKSNHFFDRFLDVFFLRLGSVALLRRDFNTGAYGPDAPQGGALIARIEDYKDPRDALHRV